MLGKKRNLENIRQSINKLDSSHFSSSNCLLSWEVLKGKELSNLYNMERSICFSCVKTKNKKYPTNKFIPCIPFPISS